MQSQMSIQTERIINFRHKGAKKHPVKKKHTDTGKHTDLVTHADAYSQKEAYGHKEAYRHKYACRCKESYRHKTNADATVSTWKVVMCLSVYAELYSKVSLYFSK